MLVVTCMVELQHDDVCFPAIYAGVIFEVVVYVGAYTHAGSFTVPFGLGNNLVPMLRVMPAARFPTFLYVAERHGAGLYHGSDRLMKGKGVAQTEETPPLPKGPQCRITIPNNTMGALCVK